MHDRWFEIFLPVITNLKRMYSLFYIKVYEFHNMRYNFHERNVISISKEKKLLTERNLMLARAMTKPTYKVASIISEDHPRQKNNRVGISPVSRNELTVIQRFRHWNEPWKIPDCSHVRSGTVSFDVRPSRKQTVNVDNYFAGGDTWMYFRFILKRVYYFVLYYSRN